MNPLTIHRWHNCYVAQQRLPAEQLQQWDAALYTLDLSRDIDALLAPGELVFIRQLQLKTRLGDDVSPTQAAERWRHALLRELCQALDEEQSPDVVRYPSRRDALADMLYRSCCGDGSRRWVWQQMGVINSSDHGCAVYLQRVLMALEQDATLIWPALGRLLLAEASTGAFSVLLQRCEPQQLQSLLAACPQTRPWLHALSTDRAVSSPPPRLPDTPLLRALLRWLEQPCPALQRHPLNVQVLLAASALSPTMVTPTPTAASAASARQWLAAADAVLSAHLHAAKAGQPRGTGRHLAAPTPRSKTVTVPLPPVPPRSQQPARPALAEPANDARLPLPPVLPGTHERVPTAWGGLLFLLPLIPPSQCLSRLQQLADHSALPADALPRLLWQLGHLHLGVPASDAALRAFCGGWQPHATLLDEHGCVRLPPPLASLARDTAAELFRLLLLRLPDGEPDFATLCRRPGMLQFEAGWIELHLPLQSADTRLRRAALDLNPGWLPWLGCVVRFSYE